MNNDSTKRDRPEHPEEPSNPNKYQSGPDAELAERLLNEVSAARVCLLDEKAKSNYDGQLKEKQTPGTTQGSVMARAVRR
ncbi:MAG: hypothetical protein P8N76_17660 [Pirellulaceae bacterium]|nr:hypothetical protein [Pirellulaceae bacterium]